MSPSDDRNVDRELSSSLRRLGTSGVPVEEPDAVTARRERLVPDLTRFAEGAFASRRRRQSYGWLAAVAAIPVVAFVVVGLHRVRGAAPDRSTASISAVDGAVRVAGNGLAVGASHAVQNEDRIETLAGRAVVHLVSGATAEVDPMTELELEELSRSENVRREHLALPHGRVDVSVPKLGRGSLVVETPNAVVTVHGTRFSVEVVPATADWATETRVAVSEGRVSVKSGGREIFLDPGARWSSAVRAADATASAPPPEPSVALSPTTRVATPPKSTLAEESRLFASALSARHRGDQRSAVVLLDRLLAVYPSSPLAGEAKTERASALAELTRASGP